MNRDIKYDLNTSICWFCENGSEKASGQWSLNGRHIVHHKIFDGDLAPYHKRFDYCPVCGGSMYQMSRKQAADTLMASMKKYRYTEAEIDALHFTCDLLQNQPQSVFSKTEQQKS